MAIDNHDDEVWMRRCFDLARRGIGHVSPNPPVGAVLVHDGKILSEGYHTHFGGPHAEVETFNKVASKDKHLIPHSILYVSLEPCCIYNKTPPCTELLIKEGVKDVRVSTVDPNPAVAGNGIAILNENNIKTTSGILEKEGKKLIRAFTTNILHKQPYVILKWAQSKEGYLGRDNERILLSHTYTSSWSHQLRAGIDVILVGARTVVVDNPKLTTRMAPGRSPHRAVYDPGGKLDAQFEVFNDDGCKVFYFSKMHTQALRNKNIIQFILHDTSSHAMQMKSHLFSHQIGTILVEGGAYLLNLFIQENEWNEAWVIRTNHTLADGNKAPSVTGTLIEKIKSASDIIVGIENDKKKN